MKSDITETLIINYENHEEESDTDRHQADYVRSVSEYERTGCIPGAEVLSRRGELSPACGKHLIVPVSRFDRVGD